MLLSGLCIKYAIFDHTIQNVHSLLQIQKAQGVSAHDEWVEQEREREREREGICSNNIIFQCASGSR